MPKKKTERSRNEQIKYRAVVNYYGSVPLAQKARGWSEERILKELGLKVPKNLPKLKEKPTDRQIKTRFTILEKYKLAQEQHTIKESLTLRNYNKKVIVHSNEYKQTIKTPLPATQEFNRRVRLWQRWSKNDYIYDKNGKVKRIIGNMPLVLVKLAEATNQSEVDKYRKKRYDRTDHYGYTALFYSFTRQESLSSIKASLIPVQDYNDSPSRGVISRRR
jgi:hypothetical protein